jgi:hypothetical protein
MAGEITTRARRVQERINDKVKRMAREAPPIARFALPAIPHNNQE